VPPSTARDILKRAGLGRAPRRSGPACGQFLKPQAERILACGRFPLGTVFGQRICVLFLTGHATRAPCVVGATTNPVGARVARQARDLLMDMGERAGRIKFLIRDRDAQYTGVFDEVPASLGARVTTTPVRCLGRTRSPGAGWAVSRVNGG